MLAEMMLPFCWLFAASLYPYSCRQRTRHGSWWSLPAHHRCPEVGFASRWTSCSRLHQADSLRDACCRRCSSAGMVETGDQQYRSGVNSWKTQHIQSDLQYLCKQNTSESVFVTHLMLWLQLWFEYDTTMNQLRSNYHVSHVRASIRRKQKWTSVFCRSHIAVESNAHRNCNHFRHSRMRHGIIVL